MAEMDSPDEADRDDVKTANTESMTEAAVRPEESMPSAGQEAPRTQVEVQDAMRGLRRAPRRVDIRREGGSYTINFGGRNLASFCEEFSEITGYSMPPNTRQQVYITVEPIGQVRDWEETPEFTRALAQQQEDQAQAERVDAPDLSEASLERLVVDIPDRALPQTLGRHRTLGEILERQINRDRDAQRQTTDARENAPRPMREDPPSRPEPRPPDYAGALLRSMRHPEPEPYMREEPTKWEAPGEPEGNIGWRATATYHLRREIDVIADMIDRLERL